jgi:hypothetical protein
MRSTFPRILLPAALGTLVLAVAWPLPGAGAPRRPALRCKEVNRVVLSLAEAEAVKLPGAFRSTHQLAYLMGMRMNDRTTSKHGHVILANYAVKLGDYGMVPPEAAGQVALQLAFKTDDQVVAHEQSLAAYQKLALRAGTFPPAWMSDKQSVAVSLFLGGSPGGKVLTMGRPTGTATLTHASAAGLCGAVDVTTRAGSTVKGSFAVRLERDLWAR